MKFRVEQCEVLVKEAADHHLVSDKVGHTQVRHCLTSLLEQLTTKMLKPNSNRYKRAELWAKSFVNLGCHFPCAASAKIPRSMYAPVPQAMAQFVLKIEILSHIMGPTLILGIARAYHLRP